MCVFGTGDDRSSGAGHGLDRDPTPRSGIQFRLTPQQRTRHLARRQAPTRHAGNMCDPDFPAIGDRAGNHTVNYGNRFAAHAANRSLPIAPSTAGLGARLCACIAQSRVRARRCRAWSPRRPGAPPVAYRRVLRPRRRSTTCARFHPRRRRASGRASESALLDRAACAS